MTFSTWRALGNTYVVAEPAGTRLDAEAARLLADGADGVLEVLDEAPRRVEIAIWNSDGSRAEMSGNGTRIAAAWLAARSGEDEVDVVVGDRVVVSRMLDDGIVEQDLGAVVVGEPDAIEGVRFTPVSVGNPHAVVVGDPGDVLAIGPRLETHARFPERTNVQVVRIDAPGEVTARVWERGVGETASSGTSAVAVAAATHGDGDVRVHFPGGDLQVHLEGGRALLYGTAERVA
jgi:diaminopimelate epimerase